MSIPEEVKVAEPAVIDQEQNTQDINWKAFREQRAAERKQAEDARKEADASKKQAEALKAAMEALLNKNQPTQASNPYDSHEETEEQRIERLVEAKMELKERDYEKKRQDREHAEIPLKMKQIHVDFEEVCSQDNIDYLEHHHPEIYRAFKNAPDSIQKFGDAYKVIKKLIPNYNSKKDESRADKNSARPQSMNSPGVTQTSDTMVRAGLDQNKKNDNWKRMVQRMKSGA